MTSNTIIILTALGFGFLILNEKINTIDKDIKVVKTEIQNLKIIIQN